MANNILAKLAVQITANQAEFSKALSQSSKNLNNFAGEAANIGKSLVAGFGLLEVAKGIINVTGEFQRFEAVLSNTLGSSSKAQNALALIKDFASQTPFEVNELTGAFVKLANQGFTPNVTQLRSLGDLASSTGKSFDQLAEAIIDAQTGEFERLKEFGIRAQKQGDQVQFTFKGVQTQVKFTSEEIRNYILSLGDAEGVSGSMSKISETLEGRISNLGDAWSNLLLTIGQGNSGVLTGAVTALTNIVNTLANVGQELEIDQWVLGMKEFKDLSDETLDYITNFLKANSGKKISDIIKPVTNQDNASFFDDINKSRETFIQSLIREGEELEVASGLWKRYVERRIEAKKVDNQGEKDNRLQEVIKAREAAEKFFKDINTNLPDFNTLEEINNKIKVLTGIKNTSTADEIGRINVAIEALQSKAKRLNETGLFKELTTESTDPFDGIDFEKANTEIEKIAQSWYGIPPAIQETLDKVNAFEGEVATPVANVAETFIEFSGIATNALSGVGEALGNAIAGTANFGQEMIKVLLGFAKQVGETLIAIGVGMIAAKAALKNPYTAIAAGIALVALSSALSSSLSKAQGNLGGGGGSSAATNSANTASQTRSSSSAQDSNPTLTTVIRGQDLWVVLENYNRNAKALKPSHG